MTLTVTDRGQSWRQFATITTDMDPFITEMGETIPHVQIAYETWGTLNATGDNAILIAHALTGDAHAAAHDADDQPGWFDGLIGSGRAIDTDRYFVICSNLLGGCNGSTGPRSINPETGKRYNLTFPAITIRDFVRSQKRLIDQLGIKHVHSIIGGSLGGMQALEWAAMFPDFVSRIVPIASSGRFSPQGIAYNEVQRRSIFLDPKFRSGEYDDENGPTDGLAVARMLGMITYQSDALMSQRFGRSQECRYTAWEEFQSRFDVEGYLHYQGDKLTRRFDANSYLYLTRAMDSHDMGWNRESYEAGLAMIQAQTLTIGITSDILFPAGYSIELAETLQRVGKQAEYFELVADDGHDAFLKDFHRMAPAIEAFLERRLPRCQAA